MAQQRSTRIGRLTGLIGLIAIPIICLAAMGIANATTTGDLRYLVAFGSVLVLLSPMVAVMVPYNLGEKAAGDALVGTLTRQLARTAEVAGQQAVQRLTQARRQDFESRLANALDMAAGEPEVVDVIERSFKLTMPHAPVELLLADNSHAHLLRMASVSPTAVELGCSVDSPDHCPPPVEPSSSDSTTAKTSTHARSFAAGPADHCRRCACRCRSWAVLSASSTPRANLAPRCRMTL